MDKIINSFKEKKIKIVNDNGEVLSQIQYSIDDFITIQEVKLTGDKSKDDLYLEQLIKKLVAIFYYLHKDIKNKSKTSLLKHHFKIEYDEEVLKIDEIKIKRFVAIGDGEVGAKNNICDVDGVRVGHFTIHEFPYNTGVSVVSPHEGNIFTDKVVASSYSFNGFGKSIGLVQVEELGTIETNIALTTTLNAGKICDAVIQKALDENQDIAISTSTVNVVVMECNDGDLNKSRDRILDKNSYTKALENLNCDFPQGDVGAGAGMICHGFKGGIGSSSRKIVLDGKTYTIGILVNSNFGSSNGKDLIFKGRPLGTKIKEYLEDYEEKGSIVVVFATDIPVNERQIKRILKRIEIGIGRTGSYAGNGSGDVFVGFSTANKRKHYPEAAIAENLQFLSDSNISPIFKRVVEATEEAVLNSMLFSKPTTGFQKSVKSLNEVSDLFIDLLDEEIIWDIN